MSCYYVNKFVFFTMFYDTVQSWIHHCETGQRPLHCWSGKFSDVNVVWNMYDAVEAVFYWLLDIICIACHRWKVQFWAPTKRNSPAAPETIAVSAKCSDRDQRTIAPFGVTVPLSRPLALELTAMGESVVMENLEIFRMNGSLMANLKDNDF